MEHPIRDGLIPVILASFILGCIVGTGMTAGYIRDSAVQSGVAEWRCNPKTGEVKFEWISQYAPK